LDFGFWILDFGLKLLILEFGFKTIRNPKSKIQNRKWEIPNPKSPIQNQKKGGEMNETEMKNRTKNFAKDIIRLCRNMPDNREGRLIGNQIFRSGTSVAANYRAACRAKSTADFISKLAIVEEEADETLFWLELIAEMKIPGGESTDHLMKENNEILAIVVASIKTARKSKK
jgi:four helix bundle protein